MKELKLPDIKDGGLRLTHCPCDTEHGCIQCVGAPWPALYVPAGMLVELNLIKSQDGEEEDAAATPALVERWYMHWTNLQHPDADLICTEATHSEDDVQEARNAG